MTCITFSFSSDSNAFFNAEIALGSPISLRAHPESCLTKGSSFFNPRSIIIQILKFQ